MCTLSFVTWIAVFCFILFIILFSMRNAPVSREKMRFQPLQSSWPHVFSHWQSYYVYTEQDLVYAGAVGNSRWWVTTLYNKICVCKNCSCNSICIQPVYFLSHTVGKCTWFQNVPLKTNNLNHIMSFSKINLLNELVFPHRGKYYSIHFSMCFTMWLFLCLTVQM